MYSKAAAPERATPRLHHRSHGLRLAAAVPSAARRECTRPGSGSHTAMFPIMPLPRLDHHEALVGLVPSCPRSTIDGSSSAICASSTGHRNQPPIALSIRPPPRPSAAAATRRHRLRLGCLRRLAHRPSPLDKVGSLRRCSPYALEHALLTCRRPRKSSSSRASRCPSLSARAGPRTSPSA